MSRGGKSKKKGNKRGNSSTSKDASDRPVKKREDWSSFTLENPKFIEYYKKQGILAENEVKDFMDTCQRGLCTSFRINVMPGASKHLKQIFKGSRFDFMKNLQVEEAFKEFDPDCPIGPPQSLSWYEDDLGWQVDATRRQIRKIPQIAALKRYLMMLDANGFINRQEVVSMVPPLLLGVESHHIVLDMCAAPGSKTSQLVDALHDSHLKKGLEGSVPSGLVIANDSNYKRTHMLVHQLTRRGSPCFIASHNSGQHFPSLYIDQPDGTRAAMKFDRILCDVPCSGDGTIRKNIDIWRNWDVRNGHGLHRLQLLIGRRGWQLLKDEGLMVYSTCSLNPIENEAVVAELLRESNGYLELVDTSDQLKGLLRNKGVSSWFVEYKGSTYYNYDEVPEEHRSQVNPSFFPPTEEEAKEFQLDRCMRILPHQQDSGGFFVSLLRKLKNPKTTVKVKHNFKIPEDEEKEEDAYMDPFKRLDSTESGRDMIQEIKDFFGISDEFPFTNCFSRSSEESKHLRLYLVSDASAKLIQSLHAEDNFKLAHAGLRVFEKTSSRVEAESLFRITHGAVHFVKNYMSKQKVFVPLGLFKKFIEDRILYLDKAEELYPEAVDAIRQQKLGCILLELDPTSTMVGFDLVLAAWSSNRTLTLMIKKETGKQILDTLEHAL